MSEENVERVRLGYEAFARGDIDWLVEDAKRWSQKSRQRRF
jgi:hypothetical protein